MSAIAVRGFTKRFGATLAVDDLTFDVEGGRVTGFLGPNGAGKTTTLRAALGLVRPTAGEVTINGTSYRRLPDPARAVGALLEDASTHPAHSGRNHLRVLARATGIARGRVEEVLEEVGLDGDADRRVGGYSMGMRQRLGLAAALLGDPPVLILDEPANGLDPQGVRWLRELLVGRARRGGAVLVSSHVLSEVAQIADDVVIIDRGRLVSRSSVAELTGRLGGGTRVRSDEAERLAGELRGRGAEVDSEDDGALVVRGMSSAEVGRAAADLGVALSELASLGSSLEDAFLSLTRDRRVAAGDPREGGG